ncbi:MAG: serine/threonine protein kinase [Deltaproteobacteria bacterium]|nr:serine/threonine protein kinase [Deltaproteobacteria bacterium]
MTQPPPTPQHAERREAARALTRFKALVDLDEAEREAALADLDREDPALAGRIRVLFRRDAEAGGILDQEGGGQRALAADLMASLVSRGAEVREQASAAPTQIGPYRVVGVLGRGGMGVVYEAEQDQPRRRVAIKTVHPWLRSPELAARFEFEVQALASLRHRSIPRLYEVREDAGTTWMVMELVDGERLDRALAGRGEDARLAVLLEVMDGVHHAHEAGIVHRDLKPGNIVVADGQPRILDFGLAAPLEPDARDAAPDIAGTLAYMAPEQLDPNPEVRARADHRADVFALGILLGELLGAPLPEPAGRPQRPRLDASTLAAWRSTKQAGPFRLPPRVREDLASIVAKATSPEPAARYASVADLAQDLRRYLAASPVTARRASLVHRARLFATRHRGLVRGVLITTAAALLVVLAIVTFSALDAAREARAREARAAERLTRLDAELEALGAGQLDRDPGRADALFAFFAAMPDNAGTRALHDAWLRRGAQLEAVSAPKRVDSDTTRHAAARLRVDAKNAFANAYATAVDETGQRAALHRLGRAFADDGAWDSAERVVARLDRLGDSDPRLVTLRAELYAARRDLAAASRLDTPLAPVLAALGKATSLGEVATLAFLLDPQAGPRRPEHLGRAPPSANARLVVFDQRTHSMGLYRLPDARAAQHAIALAHTLTLPPELSFRSAFPREVPGLDDWIAAPTSDGVGLWRVTSDPPGLALQAIAPLSPERVSVIHALRGSGAGATTLPDLVRPAAGSVPVQIALGTAGGDRVLGLWRSGQGLSLASREVVGPPSDVDALLAADLDGDGRDELVALLGAWGAYEVRVLRASTAATEPFTLVARLRFGAASDAALLPRRDAPPLIAVAKVDRYPSPTLLGQDHPFGAPRGLHLLALLPGTADAPAPHLETIAFLPFPTAISPSAVPYSLVSGDFDGDGLCDLALGMPGAESELLLVYRQVAPLDFVPTILRGLAPLAVANLDDDPADELVVRFADGGHVGWVLGLGSDALPIAPACSRPVAEPPPDDLETGLADAWHRAAELAEMGLRSDAARALEAASRLAANALTRADFLIRAGALRAEDGDPRGAAAAFEAALAETAAPGDSGGSLAERRDRAHLGAARSLLEAHDIGPALGHAQAVTSARVAEARALSDALAPIASRTAPPLDLIRDGRMHAAWRMEKAGAFAQRPGRPRTVSLDTYNQDRVLAVMPVRQTGGQIVLDLALTLEHLEIGAGLRLGLRRAAADGAPPASPAMFVEIWGTGGGTSIERIVGCGPWDAQVPPSHSAARPITAPDEPLRLRLDYLPGPSVDTAGEVRCEVGDLRSGAESPWVSRRYPGPALGDGADWELVLEARGERAWDSALRLTARIETLTVTGLEPRRDAPPTALEAAHRALFEGDPERALALYEGHAEADFAALRAELQLGRFEAAQRRAAWLGERWVTDPDAWNLVRALPSLVVPLLDPVHRERVAGQVYELARRYIDDPDLETTLTAPTLSELPLLDARGLGLVTAAARIHLRNHDPERAEHLLARAWEAPWLATARDSDPETRRAWNEATLLRAAAALARGELDQAQDGLERWLGAQAAIEPAIETLGFDPEARPLTQLVR